MNQLKLFILTAFILLQYCAAGQQNIDSLFQTGLTAMQNYRYTEAQPIFYECHRSDPTNQLYLEKLGLCNYQMGNLQEGRFYLKEALKKDSFNIQTLNLLSTIEEQLLDYRSALVRAEMLIRLDSTNAYYHRMAGQLTVSLGETPKAIVHYAQALRLNPTDQVTVVAYCKLLADQGYLPYADSLMDVALRKQQKNLRLLYESAKLKYASRQFDQVISRFESVFSLRDTNYTYLPLYAYSLAQMDSCDAALPWLRLLVMHSEKPNEQLHYFLGHCYQVMDSLEMSFTQYELAILAAQSPNLGFYYQLMGDVMGQQKRYKLALKYYEQALENNNQDPLIHFNMAAAFDQLNAKDKRRAIASYKLYLKNYDGKRPDLKQYTEKRIKELEYYDKHIWKGD